MVRKGSKLNPGVLLGEMVKELELKRQQESDPEELGERAWRLS